MDRKKSVLWQLGQESEPITLKELVAKLGEGFPPRSVRRWLDQMVAQGIVSRTGKSRGLRYCIVRPAEMPPHEEGGVFSRAGLAAIEAVRQPLGRRLPVAYSDDWFASYVPNKTFYLPDYMRERLCDAGNRAHACDPAGTYAHKVYQRLLIDLSYNSSRLEGNTYSKADTEKLLLSGTEAEGKLDEEKVMILNHKEAIRFLIDQAGKIAVDEKVIYTLHYLLSDGLLEQKYSGFVRDHWVRISGSVYIPFEGASDLERRIGKIAAKARKIEDPFEQSFFLLVHISYLQAFADVNKRTARLACNIPLVLGNLVPLSFNDIDRDDYMSAMIAIYELQNVQPMVDLFVFSYMRTCAAYDGVVQAMNIDEIRVRYREERRRLLREIIRQCLKDKEMRLRAEQFAAKYIPEEAREHFLGDLFEDIASLSEHRIAGLGITLDELNRYNMVKKI